MTEAEATAVYDVLVRECGAAGWLNCWCRYDFVRAFTSDRLPSEWLFCGALGFGAKFYPSDMRVGYQPKDHTPERRAMVERANAAPKEMVNR